jgi:hypothetical protein
VHARPPFRQRPQAAKQRYNMPSSSHQQIITSTDEHFLIFITSDTDISTPLPISLRDIADTLSAPADVIRHFRQRCHAAIQLATR